MLLRADQTFIDEATNHAERIFPTGTGWLTFQSRLPPLEVFKDTILDDAVGTGGELALAVFANAEWQNWTSTVQVVSYELATRVGLPRIEGMPMGRAVASIYNVFPMSISQFGELDDPLSVVPALLKNVAMQVIQLLTASTSVIAQVVGQVLSVAFYIGDVVADIKSGNLGKDIVLPPLQSTEPATDTWQVNRVFEVLRKQGSGEIQFPDGSLALASNADYTNFFVPAYRQSKPWKFQWREGGIAAQQGDPQTARASGPSGEGFYHFDPGDVSTFGFMPGAGVMLRVLQASYGFYGTLRGNPVDRFAIRCRAQDRACWQTAKAFDGTRDCRQCVTAESVWPIEGLGWAYGGVQLNVTTPGENVGEFYSATNKLLGNILDLASRPGPLLYTLDVLRIHSAWKQSFENFWEFMRSEWHRYPGWGWRGLLSRLATLMVAFEDNKGTLRLGGRFPAMPRSLVTSPRDDANFTIGFEHSIFARVIEPFCNDLLRVQRFYLHTDEVAYVPPGAGALYTDEGKLKTTALAREFKTARAELLGSTKRMLIDLRRVVDPEYRRELERSGVKVSPVNPMIHGPSTQVLAPDLKPKRAPTRPKSVRVPMLAGANELVRQRPPRAQAKPERTQPNTGKAMAIGLAVAASMVAIGGAAWIASREGDHDPEAD